MVKPVLAPDDAVLRCVMLLVSDPETSNSPHPVGMEWARLKNIYSSHYAPVSSAEAELWFIRFADFIRDHITHTPARMEALRVINAAIRALRGSPPMDPVVVQEHDLHRWTQIVGWSVTVSALHAAHEVSNGDYVFGEPSGHSEAWHRDSGLVRLGRQGRYRFVSGEVGATASLIESDGANLTLGDVDDVYRQWIGRMGEVLRVPQPGLTWDTEASHMGGGYYEPFTMQIVLSVVSDEVLLHEYRHHLQYLGAVMPVTDLEADAQEWSKSLLALGNDYSTASVYSGS